MQSTSVSRRLSLLHLMSKHFSSQSCLVQTVSIKGLGSRATWNILIFRKSLPTRLITFNFVDVYSNLSVYSNELMFLSHLTDGYGAGVKKALKPGKGILFVIFSQEFAIHRLFL